MIEEKSVLKNPEKHELFYAGQPPSVTLKKVTSIGADEAFAKVTKGMPEGELAGLEVVVTVRLQPLGTGVGTCVNCYHPAAFHESANDGEVTDFWCSGTAHCMCEHFEPLVEEAKPA